MAREFTDKELKQADKTANKALDALKELSKEPAIRGHNDRNIKSEQCESIVNMIIMDLNKDI